MGLAQRRSDSASPPVSQAVIEAVAEKEGIDVTDVEPPEFEPLYAVIDPEALDSLFEPTVGGTERPIGTVSFEYAGHHVTVYSDGRVTLDE
ncbi:HalOD1 output domain-containing protein [Halovivax gelatinilyticus]|uniref:HalOD1 output domain-containing protein n=1 Tax=Halovivax gelatinilyticus TaxID=2961597 RepID=UPI0020CA6430|nr:HalOD1 output domain-containing protein [Halovivax gelatinilyticus]